MENEYLVPVVNGGTGNRGGINLTVGDYDMAAASSTDVIPTAMIRA